MIGQPFPWKTVSSLFVDPVSVEKRELLSQRWKALGPEVKLPTQGLGQKATGCGATIGIQPRCDFAANASSTSPAGDPRALSDST